MKRDYPPIEVWLEVVKDLQDGEYVPPFTLTVKGNSMYPLIRNGRDQVTVKPVAGVSLKRGDIILFRANAGGLSYVLHRVYQTKGDFIQTVGDGNLYADSWIARDRVCGVVVGIDKHGRHIDPNCWWMRWMAEIWMCLLRYRAIFLKIIHFLDHREESSK